MHRIYIAVLSLVAPLCSNAQSTLPLRVCLPSDLEPELHFYRTPDMVAVVALNYRNLSESACRLTPVGVQGTAHYLRKVTIDPGQTVHSAFRWSMEAGGANKNCDYLKFTATQPSPSVSALTPALVPAECKSWMPDEYMPGPFVPNWPTVQVEPQSLPEVPVLTAPKDTYDQGEIIEFRLDTRDQTAPFRKCPTLFEFVRDMSNPRDRESGAELREIHQAMIDSAHGCQALSPWSGDWHGAAGEFPIEVMPNGVRGLENSGKRIVSVAELAPMGSDGELRLVWSNSVTLTIVDPTIIARNWGKTESGVRADLTLDKLSYRLGESIPLHLAFENISADQPVYGRTSQGWRCAFDHLLSPEIDYTLSVVKEDGSKPQFFQMRDDVIESGGPCGELPAKHLDQGRIIAVEDTLTDHRLLPREPGVYRITLAWTAYADGPAPDVDAFGADQASTVTQRRLVTVTSESQLLTITAADSSMTPP